MFGLDPDIGGSALRLWVAAGSAALLVFVCALAFDWTRTRTVARVSVVVVGAILGGTLAWAFLNAAGTRDRAAERRGLESRAAELNVQALQPGSPLACLDGLSGDSVEAACERALFASPVTVATATTYVAARLALLSDMATYVQRGGGNIDSALVPLRRGLETDRFGFVAHTLAKRDACTSDKCKALSLLSDPSKVKANLSGQTLDRYLDRYLTVWAQAPGTPVAEAAPAAPTTVAAQTAEAPSHKPVNIDFPSADSIPAVSIMTPEPKSPITPQSAAAAVNAGQQSSAKVAGPMTMPPMPGQPGAPKTASANNSGRESNREAAKESSKNKRKQAANPPAQATASDPQASPVDPVWNAGATLASPHPAPSAPAAAAPAAAAPAANAGGGGVPLAGMPVQLTPEGGAH